ncbi:MAG TPA: YcxB family protein [Blastocatellia bacterium]|nr:YcxB family protein [Blastocatellia bacterium]
MIVEFNATLDDLVDVTMRSLARSKLLRPWNWKGLLTTVLLAGLPWFAIMQGSLGRRLFVGVAVAIIAAAIYLLTYESTVEKRVRKLCLKLVGEDKPFRVEVELAEAGIRISQLKEQYTCDWGTIIEMEETEEAIYFYRREGGGFAVRKRGFGTMAEKEQFVEMAKRQVGAAQAQ